MELSLKPVSAALDAQCATAANNHLLLLRKARKNRYILSLYDLSQSDAADVHDLVPKADWQTIANHRLGQHALLDPLSTRIYATLHRQSRLVVFSTSHSPTDSDATVNIIDLSFKSQVFCLHQLFTKKQQSHLVAAVSTTGEVVAARVTSSTNVHQSDPVLLPLDTVISVCTFNDDHLVVIGVKDATLTLCTLHFNDSPSSSLLSPTVSPSVALPTPSSPAISLEALEDWTILGSAINERCALLLFSDGSVSCITPPIRSPPGTLSTWLLPPSTSTAPDKPTLTMQSFTLLPLPEGDDDPTAAARPPTTPGGGILPLSDGYFVIAFGSLLSVWDDAYFIGHAFTRTAAPIMSLHATSHLGPLVHTTHEQLFLSVHDGSSVGLSPPSLGLAIRRKGICDDFVRGLRTFSEYAPLRAQPLTVNPTRAAAEAGGNTDHIFLRVIDSERDRELAEVRAALNQKATPTAEALWTLCKDYLVMGETICRGRSNNYSELCLARLPSDRLAAACVARCLCEVQRDNITFVVPLIDMLGSGVVSSEGVVAAMEVHISMNDSSDEQEEENLPASIVECLTQSNDFFNVLEAIVWQTVDLGEMDLVRVVHFATKKSVAHWDDLDESQRQNWTITQRKRRLLWARARRLLLKCLSIATDNVLTLQSIAAVPFNEVVFILEELERVIQYLRSGSSIHVDELKNNEEVVKKATTQLATGETFDKDLVLEYRGYGRWLDFSKKKRRDIKSALEHCLQWTSFVVDAHLTGLILDSAGRKLAERLLKIVQEERRGCAALQSLKGLTTHLTSQKNIPEIREKLHKVRITKVPNFAGLS